ncbi:hypothetical protein G7047_01640 [Diaphorobacter sp. HDW4A]|uniref:hypothetical protein n=1 Tax=Diaphorobacter sp. HDW4A TaxID=2714924 RepID=UPI00140E750A|nr:hypothetical protein [Diaphorobacter sp. HDW4A]QIL78772.1 hypothetical protein G7047_01640 [Diaphorobacter sp. HDW4A]
MATIVRALGIVYVLCGGLSGAHAADYWTNFPSKSVKDQTQVSGVLQGDDLLIDQVDARTTIFLTQTTTAWQVSSAGQYPDTLLVRAPAGGATAADPSKAVIHFAAPVIDPMIVFYSLDNTAIMMASNLKADGTTAEVSITSIDNLMIDTATVSVSGPSARGTQLTFGQFFNGTNTSQDGVGIQVGLSITPGPMADSGTVTTDVGGVAIADIRANDVLFGASGIDASPAGSNAMVTTVGTWPNGITLDPATGAVTVAAGVAVGDYTMQYSRRRVFL